MADQNSITGIVAVDSDSPKSRQEAKEARQELDSKFVRGDGKGNDMDTYRSVDHPHSVAFTDHGNKITSPFARQEYAEGMVTLARSRDWQVTQVQGSERFYNNVNEHVKQLEKDGKYDAKESREVVKEYRKYGAEAVEARVMGQDNKDKVNQAIKDRTEQDRFKLNNITDREIEYQKNRADKQQEMER